MSQDHIWAAYQDDPAFAGSFRSGRHEYLAKRVPRGTRALNIGVGVGSLEEMLIAQGVNVSCLDPDEATIKKVEQRLRLGTAARVGRSEAMPFEAGEFECVIMSEVLEHLEDGVLEKTFSEVWRVLRRGGRFLGTVPADENLAANEVVCIHCGERFHRWGHVRTFSKDSLAAALGARFENVKIRRVFFADYAALNWKGKFSALIRASQAAIGWEGSGQSFYFEATKS